MHVGIREAASNILAERFRSEGNMKEFYSNNVEFRETWRLCGAICMFCNENLELLQNLINVWKIKIKSLKNLYKNNFFKHSKQRDLISRWDTICDLIYKITLNDF